MLLLLSHLIANEKENERLYNRRVLPALLSYQVNRGGGALQLLFSYHTIYNINHSRIRTWYEMTYNIQLHMLSTLNVIFSVT